MLNISGNLSAAVRASVSLAPSDRLLFVAKHLKAQAEGADLPEAVPSGAPPVSRSELQVELSVLADKLTAAVNAAARQKVGTALSNVAMQLLQQAEARPSPDVAATPAPAASAPAAAIIPKMLFIRSIKII